MLVYSAVWCWAAGSISSSSDHPELVGFFDYSRQDGDDSRGALSTLRERIQRELRGQLSRTMKTLRLWQDKEAVAPGKLWEPKIKTAVEHVRVARTLPAPITENGPASIPGKSG